MAKKRLSSAHILSIALVIAVVAALYFVITVFIARDKDVFVKPSTTTPAVQSDTAPSTIESPSTSDVSVQPTDTHTDTPSDTPSATATPSNAYINVTPPDCARECEPYKYDDKELAYCKNVCGLSSDTSTAHCDARTGLAKDYCLKDRAIAEKDMILCNTIGDDGIKKTCVTRLQQEFIENM